ncbi:MAG: glycosyltransferase family 4 protein [Candidatus Pacearchaeota archaeon]
MKIIYSVGSIFGGVGIGNTAYKAVSGIYKKDVLDKVICLDYKKTEIPKKKIKSFWPLKYLVWYPLKGVQKYFFRSFNPYAILDPFYDQLSKIYIKRIDIFHYWRNHGLSAANKAKRLGAIVVVENASSHPLTQKEILEEEYRKYCIKEKIFSKNQIKKALDELNFADYVLVPSDFAEKSFIEKGFPKEKVIKISFGVDLTKFSPKKEKKDNIFRAIFVGSIQLRKGIQYLLQAWEELNLKNAELIIVGRVWPDAEKVVESYKNNKTIKLIGFADPREYYKISDVFVFPSLEEGSALVNYEAMASGLPLITTFNSGSIARDGKEGFIVPIRNVKALKEKILYFYKNPKAAKKMGWAARKRVENFTWEKYGENLVKTYKKILRK